METTIIQDIVQPGLSKVPSASWESKVYHLAEERENEPEWKAIVKVVKARDKHSCQSCRIKIGLTVHHILPREDGGTDYPPNLITLCNYCHNEIEELGFRVKEQIIDFKRKRKYIKQDTHIVSNETPIKWQQWVYGGYKKP
uniref:Putative homing endonuclease n=1 Tax=viral metagenome TaxID=1070528 RepID=A0A6M3KL81_9ZZZZ